MTNAAVIKAVKGIHDTYRYWRWDRLAGAIGVSEFRLYNACMRGSEPRADTMDMIRGWYEANCSEWPVMDVEAEGIALFGGVSDLQRGVVDGTITATGK